MLNLLWRKQMKSMKTIGIVSACLGGTTNFYTQLCQYSLSAYHNKTPELILHQQPLQDYFAAFGDVAKGKIFLSCF